MPIKDNRFYMTSGSRWRVMNGIYTDYIRYPRGAEFTLHAYDDRTRKLAIRCPEHIEYYECTTDARRYERHKFVTGTINYARVKRHEIELVEPARGRVYFIRSGERHYFYGQENNHSPQVSTWVGDATVFMQELPAWKMMIMDAARIMRTHTHDSFNLDAFTVHAYDPVTETECQLDLPEWKHRLFRWMAIHMTKGMSRTTMGSLVLLVLKADQPITLGEVQDGELMGWRMAEDIQARLGSKVRAGHKYLFFRSEEDAIMTKMASKAEITLFNP